MGLCVDSNSGHYIYEIAEGKAPLSSAFENIAAMLGNLLTLPWHEESFRQSR